MDEKLIELVRECEELYDMSNKKYSDNDWREKVWGQIGEELNKSGSECKQRWTSLRDQYRKHLKKVSTKSGQSALIKIPKWKYADEMSFVRPYLRERDSVTNLEVDEFSLTEDKHETVEEHLLKTESEHDRTAEPEEQIPACTKNKVKKKNFRETLKRPVHQPEMASTVPKKYLVASDTERQAEPLVDPIDTFFKSIAATVKTFSPYHQNICKSRIFAIVSEMELAEILQDTHQSMHSSEHSSGSP